MYQEQEKKPHKSEAEKNIANQKQKAKWIFAVRRQSMLIAMYEMMINQKVSTPIPKEYEELSVMIEKLMRQEAKDIGSEDDGARKKAPIENGGINRFIEVLFKKEYTSNDERIHDSRYLTRINIVIITLAVLITIINLGKFALKLLGYW